MPLDTNYQTDDDPALKNPERGMYFARTPGPGDSHTIVPEWLWLDTVCAQDLTWNGLNQSGTSPILNDYAHKLENCRAAGVKVLFRPRYDKPGSNSQSGCMVGGLTVFHADSKARQFNHIDAVAAMLGEYRDVIAFIQAGYLGQWGEWHSQAGGFGPANAPLLYNEADRRDIIDRILSSYAAAGIPKDVELRRPVFAEEVLNRDPQVDVGLHNDCFMSNSAHGLPSDFDTYRDFAGSPANHGGSPSDQQKHWLTRAQQISADHSFGGETCPLSTDPNDPLYGTERWRSCTDMRSEPATLHMDYLNGDYAEEAVPTWEAGGCYSEIQSRLGYRFEVMGVDYTLTVAAGQSFSVAIDISNSGWARFQRPPDAAQQRVAKLVLRSGTTTHVYDLSNGVTREWAPGTTTQLSVTTPAPPAGTYEVRLAIPDPDAPTHVPYAVKMASLRNGVNVFDENTGENNLGVSITVQ